MPSLLTYPLALMRRPLSPWLLVLAGLCALYLPSFIDLFNGAWGTDRNAHGPIVLGVSFFFLYYRVRQMAERGQLVRAPARMPGCALLGLGLLCYALGRSQNVLLLEIGSLLVVLSGIVVLFFGLRTWSRMWFAFFFMLFMIPLPASVVDAVTLPLKISVSYATEHLLYWMGYPIARSGVILTIGQYQLLVADACAGLNSLFTLEALGLLYMNMVRHPSLVRNVALATLIVPISFTANTIRILVLALITYYMGDAAGQGFLHGLSGMLLFLSALMLIVGVDSLLSWMVRDKSALRARAAPKAAPIPAALWQSLGNGVARPAAVMLVAMLATVFVAHQLTPRFVAGAARASLAASVPKQFGGWTEISAPTAQAELSTTAEGGADTGQLYDDVLMRTYGNQQGEQMMLALAFAKEQRQDVKIHLPEICYPAQGYKVLARSPAALAVLPGGATVPAVRLLANGNNRLEAVSYWVRTGDAYPQGGLAIRMKIFRDGMAGKVVDGILVRASMLIREDGDAAAAYATQERFLRQLVTAVDPQGISLIAQSKR